ncbi:hypothetical protein MOQ_000745 [Trypanosoma cruzi marinkellei]|uniref:DUF4139 domain-containing protein n=1 Tax=Trypanosoma cruzi marinkellei TaxID=85056 RepID=K2PDM8_TRYCR|nr:hypothetical protein MOQ_000745 [Trypanosoma cruzi marinkellei]
MPRITAGEDDDRTTDGVVIRTDSKADAVTVYENQMYVRRVAEVDLPATVTATGGNSAGDDAAGTEDGDDVMQLLFAMPREFERDSVQVRFDERTAALVVLRGVLFEENSVEDDRDAAAEDKQRQETQDQQARGIMMQLREVEQKIELNQVEQSAAMDEAELSARLFARACGLLSDGVGTALEVGFWEAQLAGVENATVNANEERRRLEKDAAKLQEEKERLQSLLNETLSGDSASSKQTESLCIVLKVKEAVPNAVVYVSYMSPGASWRAEYEVVLDSQQQLMTLHYNAVVRAYGEGLHDVALTLSSVAPRRGAAEPQMEPWYLSPNLPNIECPHMLMLMSVPDGRAKGSAPLIEAAAASETMGMVNFTVPSRRTLRGDGSKLRVPLTVLQWKADVSYSTVPSVTEAVFATAVCTNAEEYQILPGEATVMLDGNFVANTHLTRTAPGEKLRIPFGVDSSIEVHRKLQERYTTNMKTNLFNRASRKRLLFSYVTNLTNTKSQENITVTVQERIPKSNEQKLSVRLLEPKTDATDWTDERQRRLEVDGVVEMQVTLKPGGEVTVPFAFEVEAPIDAHIYGL